MERDEDGTRLAQAERRDRQGKARQKNSGGGGLWLYKREDDGAQWVPRYSIHGRRHEMGLGRFPNVTLREAREEADKWRGVVRQGKDAIKERERQRRAAERTMHLQRDIATDAFESCKAKLKGDGEAGRWFSPLELHVLPKLSGMPLAEIDQRDIRDTLAPIWRDKADTARKAMNRGSICMRHAAALGLDVDLQAKTKVLGVMDNSIPGPALRSLGKRHEAFCEGTYPAGQILTGG